MALKPILIVEGDFGIRSSLQLFFEADGYPVLLADHGQAALDLLEKNSTPKPGLIILDFMMPVMDGPSFLLELQRNHPEIFAHIPIFIISAGAAPQLTIKTTGFLKKPFDLNELSRVAKQYCDHDD